MIAPNASAAPQGLPESVRDLVRPDFHQTALRIEDYLKVERGFKLDADESICRLSLLPPGCPLGPAACPFRHAQPSSSNFKPMPVLQPTDKKSTVCRHFLRGLCKLGDDCPWSHDFNLRTMPICALFEKYGKCSIGGECLYLHRSDIRVECPDFNRGFCPLGPSCSRKHIRRRLCEAYQAGYCPDGPRCAAAHPSIERPSPGSYINPVPPDPALAPSAPQVPAGYGRWRGYRHDPEAQVQPAPAWVEGGSLSSWRSGGFLSANARKGDERDEAPRPRTTGWVKDLSTVLCFRCNEYGHFANTCPNEFVPGDRGGGKKNRAP